LKKRKEKEKEKEKEKKRKGTMELSNVSSSAPTLIGMRDCVVKSFVFKCVNIYECEAGSVYI